MIDTFMEKMVLILGIIVTFVLSLSILSSLIHKRHKDAVWQSLLLILLIVMYIAYLKFIVSVPYFQLIK